MKKQAKKEHIKDALIRIDKVCSRYGKLPSEMLFPQEDNPNFILAINNLVYEIGEVATRKEELELRKLDDHKDSTMMNLMAKMLSVR